MIRILHVRLRSVEMDAEVRLGWTRRSLVKDWRKGKEKSCSRHREECILDRSIGIFESIIKLALSL